MSIREYPYISERVCIICKTPLVIQKGMDNKILCSNKCRIEHLKIKNAEKAEKNKKACEKCQTIFKPKNKAQRYCSLKCAYLGNRVAYDRYCLNCGKHFQVNNISQIKRGDHIYCSKECSKKKSNFREEQFLEQTPESMYWLGFIYASVIEIDEQYIMLEGTKTMLEKLLIFLSGNVPLVEKGTLCRLPLYSRAYVQYMSALGLRVDYYKEAPLLQREFIKDFIRGYFDSTKGFIYNEKNKNVVAIHGEDSKLMRYFADMLGGILRYKEKEWIVVCFDFEVSCNGLPKNLNKWKKFKTFE